MIDDQFDSDQAKSFAKCCDVAMKIERERCARIAREQFLVTPNGRDCGEHIAQLIEKP